MLIFSLSVLLTVAKLGSSLDKDAKIFGGKDCDIARFPFYIYIEYIVNGTKYMCGGSLISVNSVLTAGHCCVDVTKATLYSGYIRTTDSKDQNTEAILPPSLHPDFNYGSLVNDVCIFKAAKPFKLTKRTKLVNLAPKKKLQEMMENDDEDKTYELQLMGYGANKADGKKKNRLFRVDTTIPFQCTTSLLRTQKRCPEGMKDASERSKYSPGTMFCHYNPEANRTKGSCEGDSGSPIMYANAQVGLISWGPNEEICTERMEVSARLDVVYDWVVETGMARKPLMARTKPVPAK